LPWISNQCDFEWRINWFPRIRGALFYSMNASLTPPHTCPLCCQTPKCVLPITCSVVLGFDSSSAVFCPLIKVVIADQRLGLGLWCVCKLPRNSTSKYRRREGPPFRGKRKVPRGNCFHAWLATITNCTGALFE